MLNRPVAPSREAFAGLSREFELVCDSVGELLWLDARAEAAFGSALGRTLESLAAQGSEALVAQFLFECRERPVTEPRELVLRAGDSPRRVWLSGQPFAAGIAVLGSFGSGGLRAEELSEASRRKDEFLGMLAHELRNPLNAISAANTVLDRLEPRDAQRVRLHAVIGRQTRHLARMVDDLLEVSRITRGQLQLRKGPLDLVRVVRQAVEGARGAIDGRQQRLSLELPDRPVETEADDLRLEQVVFNLLNNASKYSEPGASIWVRLTQAEHEGRSVAELRVRDTGSGIPKPMLGAVFEPFVQVDQSLPRTAGGLGMGLALVKSLVELHGGTVAAESAGVGQGSEFVVRLPLHRHSEERATPLPSSSEQEARRKLHILIVEDNADTRELVQAWLEMLGHSVRSADNGRSGVELAIGTRPDVALIDIGLPELDGYEVAKSLRATEGGKNLYLVAVTGYGRPEDRARALDAGFDAYLVKPIDEAALRRVLELPPPKRREPSSRANSA